VGRKPGGRLCLSSAAVVFPAAVGLGWLLTIVAALPVEGDASCPSPETLSARLASVSTTHRARVLQRGEREVELTLFDEHGQRLAQRQLSAQTCDGLVEAAAATLLAWEAMLPAPAPKPDDPRAPLQVPGPTGGAAVAQPSRAPLFWRAEAGLLGGLSGVNPTAGLTAAALLGPREAAWRARLHLLASLPLEVAVANGQVAWTRPAVGAGFALQLAAQPVQLEASAALEAALLFAWGRGFEQNFVARTVDPGAELSLRAARAVRGSLSLFLQLALNASFVQQRLQIAGVNVIVTPPQVLASLRLGVAFGR